MNFYKRFPGDYAKKTSRLTLAQHGAYTLLLDETYLCESGLPADLAELYRICRAMSKQEQQAVRSVAEMFFPVGSDGLRHNSRAAEEIREAMPAIHAARTNGQKGGRPPKPKPNGFSEDNQGGSENRTQDKPTAKAPQSSEFREDKDSASALSSRALAVATPAGEACRAMRQAGVPDVNPSHPRLLALLEAGATSAEFSDVATEAIRREITSPFAWILGTVEGRRRQSKVLPLPARQVEPKPWEGAR